MSQNSQKSNASDEDDADSQTGQQKNNNNNIMSFGNKTIDNEEDSNTRHTSKSKAKSTNSENHSRLEESKLSEKPRQSLLETNSVKSSKPKEQQQHVVLKDLSNMDFKDEDRFNDKDSPRILDSDDENSNTEAPEHVAKKRVMIDLRTRLSKTSPSKLNLMNVGATNEKGKLSARGPLLSNAGSKKSGGAT
mmetsp:Transcript_20501/g.17888  ORF Transcript_20501/g.17888 Transcript_20501/m.17888 type:complete len:191 (+) Transcript_20501:223-795(+)